MVGREDLLKFLNTELKLQNFKDIENAKFNGALVKGVEQVEKIGLCTNTTFENIETADENDLDIQKSNFINFKRETGDTNARSNIFRRRENQSQNSRRRRCRVSKR